MNKEYFRKCVERYENTVFRIAVNYCRSYHDAQDITQEVFLRFYRKVGKPPDDEQAKFYLIRMAINLGINMTKSAWRKKVVVCDNDELISALYRNTQIELEEREHYGEILSAVRDLPIKYRSVVHLYYYEDMPVKEIAGVLKLKETTVQTRLMRARAMLKEKLKEVRHENGI